MVLRRLFRSPTCATIRSPSNEAHAGSRPKSDRFRARVDEPELVSRPSCSPGGLQASSNRAKWNGRSWLVSIAGSGPNSSRALIPPRGDSICRSSKRAVSARGGSSGLAQTNVNLVSSGNASRDNISRAISRRALGRADLSVWTKYAARCRSVLPRTSGPRASKGWSG